MCALIRSKPIQNSMRPARRKSDDDFGIAPVPPRHDIVTLSKAVHKCRACPLWRTGTQAVFGEGPEPAPLLFVGEQPGDMEDREGKPFVGPAGRMLDKALEAAGISRNKAYITNAVKHFKWEPKGKRRMHQTPTMRESLACRPWLDAEIDAIKPRLLIALGGTAVRSLLGSSVKVMANRGKILTGHLDLPVLVTVHPSMLLRLPSHEDREKAFHQFVRDLKRARPFLKSSRARASSRPRRIPAKA